MLRRGIDRANRAISQPDIGMRHHCLGFAGRKVIAMRHAHRGIFMRHDKRIGKLDILRIGFGQPFDDRRKIGAGIGKDIIHPDRFHPRQNGPARGQRDVRLVIFHLTFLPYFYI